MAETAIIEIAYVMQPHTQKQLSEARAACARLPSFLFSIRRLLAGHMDDEEAVKAALLVIIARDAG